MDKNENENKSIHETQKIQPQDFDGKVYVWEEEVVIPTYPAGEAEKDPIFLEMRAYQGSSGKVYPLPVTETITDKKVDRTYKAVWLENKYLKVMILPELGGRIQRALDKTNQYDFVYYNHVIKPALVGLAGPWISGGIEFNWPQHHRPSTFMPVDYTMKQNRDGSATVFVGETDRMYGTKGMAAITLYPDKSYIEIKGQLYNRTDIPQTFLWWANPAVPVNDRTYTIFPPDVTAVMDHGKRAVMTYPIATGEYYKYDYSEGVDISCYRNIKVPTSYMAAHSDYDFIGNFDEGRDAGLLHVADHHISPGKKQWTWGNADFGRTWDQNLTDEDGPYIELMTGVYTDNQPDFTWLKPYEEKTFTQYFMPYRHTGRVCNATKDAAVALSLDDMSRSVFPNEELPEHDSHPEGLPENTSIKESKAENTRTEEDRIENTRAGESRDEKAVSKDGNLLSKTEKSVETGKKKVLTLRVSATGEYRNAKAVLFIPGEKKPVEITFDVSPDRPFESRVETKLTELDGVRVEVRSAQGKRLVRYEAKPRKAEPVPDPATPVPSPEDCKSTEELFLAAEHLEQYRHATREPADYYLEGLRRDPTDIRLNNGYGRLLYRRGHFKESILYFKKAIEKQTWKHPNPYYGESYYNLGLALRMCGRPDEAYDAFYKAIWSAETQSAGFYQLALIASMRKEYEQALAFAEQSLIRNGHHMRALALKAALLRLLDRPARIRQAFLDEAARIDPLDPGIRYERMLLEELLEKEPREREFAGNGSIENGSIEDGYIDKRSIGNRFAEGETLEKKNKEGKNRGNGFTEERSIDDRSIIKNSAAQASAEQLSSMAWSRPQEERAVQNGLELSLDYMKAGFYADARQILESVPDPEEHPMIGYYLTYVDIREGKNAAAEQHIRRAEQAKCAGCFPNRLEEIEILERVLRFAGAGTDLKTGDETMENGNYSARSDFEKSSPDTGEEFPFGKKMETPTVRTSAMHAPHASYYLGCLLYDKKQYQRAADLWERATDDDPFFAPAFRNLSIAYFNKQDRPGDALEMIRYAFELEPDNARYLMEQDQLLEKTGTDAEKRLRLLEQNRPLLAQKDVLYLSYCTLLNTTGQYEKALEALSTHRFHPWEGGEGKVSTQYRYAHTHIAMKKIALAEEAQNEQDASENLTESPGKGFDGKDLEVKDPGDKKEGKESCGFTPYPGDAYSDAAHPDTVYLDDAISHLQATLTYPQNLGEGKLPNVQDNTAYYYLGKAYRLKGDEQAARHYFELASAGLEEPGSVLYYNDQPCDTIYYQGLACRELGREKEARRWFHMLLAYGKRHIFDRAEYDYFAVSLPQIDVYKEDLKKKNDLWCMYLMALGSQGLGDDDKAQELYQKIRERQPAFQFIS